MAARGPARLDKLGMIRERGLEYGAVLSIAAEIADRVGWGAHVQDESATR